MKALSFKRYIMPLFAFFIMFAGARAADYLWEPKLLWESKESYQRDLYGLQFINDDSQVLYSADGKVYIRDAKTGEIIRQSEQFDMEMGNFRFSKDNKFLYTFGDATYLGQKNYQGFVRFDMQTLKCIDTIPSFRVDLNTENSDGNTISILSIKDFTLVSDNKILFLCSTSRYINPQYNERGYCLISMNPQKKDFSWDNKNDWKIEYYFVPSNRVNTNPIITPNNKYLIYEGTSDVKLIELETLKEYWSSANSKLIAYSPNFKHIFIQTNDNRGKIINTETKKENFNFDMNILNSDPFLISGLTDLLIDSTKIFYYLPRGACYDLSTKKISYAFEKWESLPSYFNEECSMFLSPGKTLKNFVLSTNASSINNSEFVLSETLNLQGDNLIIPTNEISPKEIIIFNTDGKLIKQFNSFDLDKENVHLNISFLNQGVYFVSVISENGNRANYKFMKGE